MTDRSRASAYAGWHEIHHAHRDRTQVKVTGTDRREYVGHVIEIADNLEGFGPAFRLDTWLIPTIIQWPYVATVEMIDHA